MAKWREKPAANGHTEFITIFQDRDCVVRHLTKLKPAKAKDVGFYSAAQVLEDLEARLEQKMEAYIIAPNRKTTIVYDRSRTGVGT